MTDVGVACRHVPLMMLWGNALLDDFLTRKIDNTEIHVILRHGGPSAEQWLLTPINTLRDKARSLAAVKHYTVSDNASHVEAMLLAERILGHVRREEARKYIASLPWHC